MLRTLALLALSLVLVPAASVADASDPKPDAAKYTLRYKFQPGETVRWDATQQVAVRTTVSGTTQVAQTVSKSVKAWRVQELQPSGAARFEHLVESVDMRQDLTGRAPLRYNSLKDQKPPHGFEDLALSLGKPLVTVTMDNQGKILDRHRNQLKAAARNEAQQMTIPLPAEPIAAGHTWIVPQDVDVPMPDGLSRKIRVEQRLTLQDVRNGVATIAFTTHVLTPIDDPTLESQTMAWESAGEVRFDLDAGRVLSQQIDVDRHVVGFRGPASSIHYVTRFTERLQPAAAKVASRSEKVTTN